MKTNLRWSTIVKEVVMMMGRRRRGGRIGIQSSLDLTAVVDKDS